MADVTRDPDALPNPSGSTTAESNLSRIREAAKTKKAVLEVERLQKQIDQEKPAPRPVPKQRQYERLDRPPTRTGLTFDQMLEYWRPIHEKYPQRCWGYLYRHFPLIVKNSPHYIHRYRDPPVDMQEILKNWGTGEYEIRLLDNDMPQGNELCRCSFKFKESYAEAPPVLDYLELDMGRHENRSYIEWARAKGFLKMGGEQSGSSAAENTAVKALADIATKRMEPEESLENEAAKTAFDMLAKASQTAIETVRTQAKDSSTSNSELFATVLKMQADNHTQQNALWTKMLERPNQNGEFMAMFIKMQTDMIAQNSTLMKSFFDFATASKKESNGTGGLKETAETLLSIADLFGAAGGRARGNGGWVDSLLQNPMVHRLGDSIGAAAVNWSQAHMMEKARQQQGAIPMPAAQGRTPAATPDGTVIYPGDPAPQQPAQQISEDAINQQFLMDFFIPRHLDFIEAIEHGIPGDEFADRLFEVSQMMPHGSGMTLGQHAQIKSIGKEKLVQLLGMAALANPNLKAMLAGKQTLVMQFLDQFLSWEPENDADVPPPPGTEERD